MRTILALIGCGLLVGCTANEPKEPPGTPVAPISRPVVPGSSSALIFDPPLLQASAHPNLDRTGRGEAAFVGFEQATTASYNVWTYNRASTDGCDTYDRSTFVGSIGTLSR